MSEHHESHDAQLHPPAITPGWKRAVVVGNLALGVAELLTGGVSSLAVTADGIHNIGDAATYTAQANDLLHAPASPEALHRRRKIAHWAIAASSALISVKAGSDLITGVHNAVDTATIYASGASFLYNGGLFMALRRGIARRHEELSPAVDCHREADLTKHFLQLDIPSAALAVGGAVAQKYGVESAEQLAALTSGIIGAVAFRPTAANLNHSH